MKRDFRSLTGSFIHHCGALEFLVNNSIKALSTDQVLSTEAIESSLFKRISLLRRLLKERSTVAHEDIESLCNELDEIRKKRNIVAHNPIISTAPDDSGQEEILVVRHKITEVSIPDKLTKDDVAELVNQTNSLIKRITHLIPESVKT